MKVSSVLSAAFAAALLLIVMLPDASAGGIYCPLPIRDPNLPVHVATNSNYFYTDIPLCAQCRPKYCGYCNYDANWARIKLDKRYQFTSPNAIVYIKNYGQTYNGDTIFSCGASPPALINLDNIQFCDGSYDNCKPGTAQGIMNSGDTATVGRGPLSFDRIKITYYGYTSAWIQFYWSRDGDGDGYTVDYNDCNDTDPTVHPGALEKCDGKDNDCNPLTLNGSAEPYFQAIETLCEGLDNDCDGTYDEGCSCQVGQTRNCGPAFTLGTCRPGTQTCDVSGSWLPCIGSVMPAEETCDGLDDDCNGIVDNGCDDDGDGYCDSAKGYSSSPACPLGGNDCNDNNGMIHPDAGEVCNDNIDNDCNGMIDCNDFAGCKQSYNCAGKTQYIMIPKVASVYRASFDLTGSSAMNPNVYIGEEGNNYDTLWGYSGEYGITESVNDFSGKLNSYISTNCVSNVSEDVNCSVPITFDAESGSMMAHSIDIQYSNYLWFTGDKAELNTYKMMLVGEETPVCGNGKLEKYEECDDGNDISDDGCSELCTKEAFGNNLQCIYSASPCQSPYIEVLRASAESDAHASLKGLGDFTYHICCKDDINSLSAEDCTQAKFLKLSSPTDAHVQQNTSAGFTNNACLESSEYLVSCGYSADCIAEEYDTCLASMSGLSDAHIGNCSAYDIQVCCKQEKAPPSPVVVPGGLLSCSIKPACESYETALLSMYNSSGSHVGEPGYYINQTCCMLTETSATLGNDCAASRKTFILGRYRENDTHVSLNPGYYNTTNDVCLSVSAGSITCLPYYTPGTCTMGSTCVATVDKDDDSHVAGCAGSGNPYLKTICCRYNP